MQNLEKWYRGTDLQSRNRDKDVEKKKIPRGSGGWMNWEISAYMAEDHTQHLFGFF